MTSMNDFTGLRLRLAIRKLMLTRADRSEYANRVLKFKFSWATREQVQKAIDELLREGLLTEKKGNYGAAILVWHEEKIG